MLPRQNDNIYNVVLHYNNLLIFNCSGFYWHFCKIVAILWFHLTFYLCARFIQTSMSRFIQNTIVYNIKLLCPGDAQTYRRTWSSLVSAVLPSSRTRVKWVNQLSLTKIFSLSLSLTHSATLHICWQVFDFDMLSDKGHASYAPEAGIKDMDMWFNPAVYEGCNHLWYIQSKACYENGKETFFYKNNKTICINILRYITGLSIRTFLWTIWWVILQQCRGGGYWANLPFFVILPC